MSVVGGWSDWRRGATLRVALALASIALLTALGTPFIAVSAFLTSHVAFLGDDSRQLLQNFASAGCGLRLVSRVPRPGAG